jgi:hypothetical protein
MVKLVIEANDDGCILVKECRGVVIVRTCCNGVAVVEVEVVVLDEQDGWLEENVEEDLDDMEVDVGIVEPGVLGEFRDVVDWDDDDEELEDGVLNVVGYVVDLGSHHHLDKSIVSARSSA